MTEKRVAWRSETKTNSTIIFNPKDHPEHFCDLPRPVGGMIAMCNECGTLWLAKFNYYYNANGVLVDGWTVLRWYHRRARKIYKSYSEKNSN